MPRRLPLCFLPATAAAAAIAAGIGAAALLDREAPIGLRSGTALVEPRPLADFALVDHRGRALGPRDFEDRWTLVFAGFTHCPDLCPATLTLLAQVRSQLPQESLRILFLSVDPGRDGPEQIAGYLAHFGQGLSGATGTPAQVEAFSAQLGLAQVRNPGAGADYTIDHSAALVLIDPQARVAGYFRPPHDAAALVADLAALAVGAG
ncbi:MAG TPA: SCO family protein [Steroidobacteraceae bacterium]|nr:SCO family protein [Steroidobacteraceae bacterium]